MADTRLLDAVSHVFDTLVDALTVAGIDVPAHRYIHAGEIAHDLVGEKCAEAFIVSWEANFQGQIGFTGGGVPEAAIRCAMPMSAQLTVVLLRCVPVLTSAGRPPTAASLDASATQILTDAWTLAAVTIDSTLASDLLTQHIDLVGIGNVSAVGPQGGVGGSAMSLMMSIL